LRRENALPRTSAKFYQAIVQSVLLNRSKTWVLSKAVMARLEVLNVSSATRPLQRHNGLVVELTFSKSVVPRAQVPRLARLLPILALSDG
jgi:hypothetical protein